MKCMSQYLRIMSLKMRWPWIGATFGIQTNGVVHPIQIDKRYRMDRKEKKATQPKEAKKRKRKRWLKSHYSGISLWSMSIACLFAGHFSIQIWKKK